MTPSSAAAIRPPDGPRTLADVLAAGAPRAEALRHALALVRAVERLHAAGLVHGALSPGCALLEPGGAVALAGGCEAGAPLDPLDPARAEAVPYAAPERLRGARASVAADVHATGAIVAALLGGAPAPAPPLEALRRALYEPPGRLSARAPGLDPALEAAVAAARERRSRRRSLGALAAALAAATGGPAEARGTRPGERAPAAASTGAARGGAGARRAETRAAIARLAAGAGRCISLLPRARAAKALLRAARAATALTRGPAARRVRARLAPALALGPARIAALVAVAVAGLGLTLGGGDGALAREVAGLLDRGELAAARARLDDAARRDGPRPVLEKLRGDLAFARGAPAECVRRYRVALAAEPALRTDERLRANARALLARADGCGRRRAAAELLGELRDPDALPALRQAKRSAGLLEFLCTGDALDRAIDATRLGPR